MWTHFMDRLSGGSQKRKFSHCYIEAPKDVAKSIFTELFGDPDNVTCSCCGSDYLVTEDDTLEQASGFQRNCKYDALSDSYLEDGEEDGGECIPLSEYVKRKDVYVLYADGCNLIYSSKLFLGRVF